MQLVRKRKALAGRNRKVCWRWRVQGGRLPNPSDKRLKPRTCYVLKISLKALNRDFSTLYLTYFDQLLLRLEPLGVRLLPSGHLRSRPGRTAEDEVHPRVGSICAETLKWVQRVTAGEKP